ncbi:MAG: Wzz/FepE/Etk N-terminal domain-containing protein, partial [Fimbriimonadales bacterium]|nr:Wzz/FepE/Etk N-terminal domain-containing protein [Fimbriimonadales bacterium]
MMQEGGWIERESTVALPWVGQALRCQWRWIAGGLLLGIMLGLGIVLFAPKRYDAPAQVLIDTPAPLPSLSGLTMIMGGGNPDVETQRQVLESRSVLERVQKRLGYTEPYRDFSRRFRTQAIRNSTVIELTASDETASKAAHLTNTWVEEYLRFVRELYDQNPSSLLAKLSQEIETQEKRLAEIDQRLVQFLQQRQLVAPDQELAKSMEKYAELVAQVREQRSREFALTRQIAELRAQLIQQPAFADLSRTIAVPPEVQELNKKIAELQIQRSEYQPDSPEARALDVQIAQAQRERARFLEQAVAGEFKLLSRQEAVNPLYQQLMQARLTAEVEREATRATVRYLEGQQAQLEAQFRKVPALMAAYGALRREQEVAQTLWAEKIKAYEQARAQQLIGRVSPVLLQPAFAPDFPAFPRPVLTTTLAVTLGLMMGMLLAFIRAWRERRLRTRWDVERLLGAPVLAEVRPQELDEQRLQLLLWSLRAVGGGEQWQTALALPLAATPKTQQVAHVLAIVTSQSGSTEPTRSTEPALPAPAANGLLQVREATVSLHDLSEAQRLLLIAPQNLELDEQTLLMLRNLQPQIVGVILVEEAQ